MAHSVLSHAMTTTYPIFKFSEFPKLENWSRVFCQWASAHVDAYVWRILPSLT